MKEGMKRLTMKKKEKNVKMGSRRNGKDDGRKGGDEQVDESTAWVRWRSW